MEKKFTRKLLAQLILGAIAANSTSLVHAYDLGVVSAGSGTGGQSASNTASAPYQAPTQGSLVATEPQSVISQQYIQTNTTGASNYTDIAQIAPSVWSVSPNGAGGSDWPGLSMRAFQDGQYNVTFDGIPFADGADFTHHVSSYFMSQDTGNVVVDRGPGNAATIGDATFGGTIAIHSKDPGQDAAFTPYVSAGSFNTRMAGVQFDTGVMQNYGYSSGFVDYKNYSTDGFLNNDHSQRGNLFMKFIKPISDNTAIKLVAMQNTTQQNFSLGATAAEIAQYGSRFGLSQDPNNSYFIGYNQDKFTSDFEYIDLNTRQGSWLLDNKLYTFAYRHDGLSAGTDPLATIAAQNLAGSPQIGLTQYRSYGDVFRATDRIGLSDLKFGLWIDRQNHLSWTNNITQPGSIYVSTNQAENSNDTTIQPYVEYAWRPTTNLTVTPGVKFNSFTRNYNASMDPTAGGPLNYSKTWTATLPSLDAHYYLADNWSVYGQVAKGFTPPPLQSFNYSNSVQFINSQTTTNYQAGSVWKSDKLTLSGDVYYIDNSNAIQSYTNNQGLTVFSNAGVARYKGFEGEATYYIGSGFSVYGNYTRNEASIFAQNAPNSTAAAGLIYAKEKRIYASLIAKEIGQRYSGFGAVDANGNPIAPIHMGSYTVVNFNTTYSIRHLFDWSQETKIQLMVNNLLNKTGIIQSAGGFDTNGNPLFYAMVERNFMVNFSTSF
ncbi:MAG: TonB-dependent receptor [Burkholderiales bacterium]|nr:TonB-dependent receptor [Burkholderiales bacterium]